jgi:hypothetical protein
MANDELRNTIDFYKFNRPITAFQSFYSCPPLENPFSIICPLVGGDKPRHYKRSFTEQVGVGQAVYPHPRIGLHRR